MENLFVFLMYFEGIFNTADMSLLHFSYGGSEEIER